MAALLKGPRKWLPHIDGSSQAAAGTSVAGLWIREKVTVTIGEPAKGGSRIEVPVTWRATSIKRMFPVMTGKVELARVDADVTRLTVCGMYEPLLSKVGKVLDDVVMHEVADATVRELAAAIAMRLAPAPAS